MAELRDFRGRISVLADCVIDTESQLTGKERQEVVREVLDAWAEQQVHRVILLHKKLASEGLDGLLRGERGSDAGSRGSVSGIRGDYRERGGST